MQRIAPSSLSSLADRISYEQSFLNFDPSTTGPAVTSSLPLLQPLLPTLLDAVYTKLLSYDITAKAFAPRQQTHESDAKYDGDNSNVTELNLNHPNIKFRKTFLKSYLVKILSTTDWTPQAPIWTYLNNVGLMHTGDTANPGFAHRAKKPSLRVEYMHMGLLLGFVEEAVAGAILASTADDWTPEKKAEVILAWNKLLWIQNDLFARHYTVDWDVGTVPKAAPQSRVSASASELANSKSLSLVVIGVLIGALLVRLSLI
ncbi:MAG: hypothetical protein Q9227_001084 [Pyrenula ochraceoflavens]